MALSADTWAKQTEQIGAKAEVYGIDTLINDEFTPTLVAGHLSDKTIHVYGTWGTGGSITFYGSNALASVGTDPETASNLWIPLKDNQDNDITKTANGGDVVIENYWYICAKVTAGDGATDLDVRICAKGC